MEIPGEGNHKSYPVIRWTARILSVASVAFLLAFVIGEKFNPALFTPRELLQFLFFSLGISTGLIIAWWMEGLGGGIAIGSLLMFYVINFTASGKLPRGWALWAFTAPAFLFLLNWLQTQRPHSNAH